MVKDKNKKCLICKKEFHQFNSLQKYCTPVCARVAFKKESKKKLSAKKREKKKKDVDWAKDLLPKTYLRI